MCFYFPRYHKHCFQGYSDNENECPTCFSENRKIIDIVKSQQTSREQHDTFHSQLEKASDGFALVAGKIIRLRFWILYIHIMSKS